MYINLQRFNLQAPLAFQHLPVQTATPPFHCQIRRVLYVHFPTANSHPTAPRGLGATAQNVAMPNRPLFLGIHRIIHVHNNAFRVGSAEGPSRSSKATCVKVRVQNDDASPCNVRCTRFKSPCACRKTAATIPDASCAGRISAPTSCHLNRAQPSNS